MSNDNKIDVQLMVLSPSEYADLKWVESDDIPLIERFPKQMYVMGINDMETILEVAGELTTGMMAMGFTEPVTGWLLEKKKKK